MFIHLSLYINKFLRQVSSFDRRFQAVLLDIFEFFGKDLKSTKSLIYLKERFSVNNMSKEWNGKEITVVVLPYKVVFIIKDIKLFQIFFIRYQTLRNSQQSMENNAIVVVINLLNVFVTKIFSLYVFVKSDICFIYIV
jgi:hypothetical protein